MFFFFSSRRRHTRCSRDWSSDVCSSDLLSGRYGDVTRMAQDREQSRQSLYREAGQVIDAVGGTAVRARIAELEQQVVQLRDRSEERRVGKECRSRRAPKDGKKKSVRNRE